ncbi:MAG: hypothetical protein HYY17_05260 [Planctomycetes bacterium]|nr:hypothetical protein [Planctomycetota bacterium]
MTAAVLLLALVQDADIERLIDRLDADDIDVRERAQEELIRIGRAALPAIEEAAKRRDEIGRRAAEAIREIPWRERAAGLRPRLSAGFLAECPDAARIATSDSEGGWLHLLRGISGRRDPVWDGRWWNWNSAERRFRRCTRRDLFALAIEYGRSPWRSEPVEAMIFHVFEEAGLSLPREVRPLRENLKPTKRSRVG